MHWLALIIILRYKPNFLKPALFSSVIQVFERYTGITTYNVYQYSATVDS